MAGDTIITVAHAREKYPLGGFKLYQGKVVTICNNYTFWDLYFVSTDMTIELPDGKRRRVDIRDLKDISPLKLLALEAE